MFYNTRITDIEEKIWMMWDIITELQSKVERLEDENASRFLERCQRDKQHEHIERNAEKKPTIWT